jgi:ABC-2 type transport system permease protein
MSDPVLEAPPNAAPAGRPDPAPSGARDTTRPLAFGRAFRAVFELSLEGMVWSLRSLLMALLLGAPIVFGLVYRLVLIAKVPARVSGFDLYAIIIAIYYVRNVVPLAALFYATSLVADEVEGKTLTYLLTRPVTRPSILLGKFLAYVVTTLALTLPATVITFFLLVTVGGFSGVGAAVPDLLRDLGAMSLTLVVYGAFFTLLGVLLRRPMIPGLLFLFGWELIANLPGYLPRFTISAWVRSLIRHRPPEEGFSGLFAQVLPWDLSLLVLSGATVVFLGLAFWIFSGREYVMEQ